MDDVIRGPHNRHASAICKNPQRTELRQVQILADTGLGAQAPDLTNTRSRKAGPICTSGRHKTVTTGTGTAAVHWHTRRCHTHCTRTQPSLSPHRHPCCSTPPPPRSRTGQSLRPRKPSQPNSALTRCRSPQETNKRLAFHSGQAGGQDGTTQPRCQHRKRHARHLAHAQR